MPELSRRKLSTPVHLLFSYDEEVGCLGVRRALEVIKDFPVKPKGCVIGEPTSMKVAIAHKGKKSVRCHVHGLECHSSLAPQGVNAVEYAAEVIGYLKRMGRRFAKEGPFDPDYDVPHTTVHTGIVKDDDGTTLTLITAEAKLITLKKADIEDQARANSAMPEDLIKKMSRRELRDLVEFLAQQKAKPKE